jgi:hypothetical protein
MKAVQASGHLARLPTLPRFQGPPGWSFNATYFHATLGGGSNVATADVLPLFPRTTLRVQLDSDIKTNVDIAILTPAYTLATPVWGGRLDFKLFIPVGGARTQIDALVTGALGPIGFSTQNSISDMLNSFGDPAPQLSLKWNEGVNNFMVYSRGGIPVGDYNADRIVNLGDGHASWDNGLGYTYFNATTGFEFSAVSGLTYNFTNPHTDYQNGIDWHVDLEAWVRPHFVFEVSCLSAGQALCSRQCSYLFTQIEAVKLAFSVVEDACNCLVDSQRVL